MGAPPLAPFGVEKPHEKATMSFNIRYKMRINRMLLTVLAICFVTWLLVDTSTMKAAHKLRNEVVDHKLAPVSSAATQLVDLQDRLSTRLAQHHEIMSSNLDEFTTILTNVNHMADQSFRNLDFLRNLLVVGSERSSQQFEQAAALLVDAEAKLRGYALDDILHLKPTSLEQSASIMEMEMKEMEVFIQHIESHVDKLTEELASTLHIEAEQHQSDASLPQTDWIADTKPQNPFSRLLFFGGLPFNGNPSNSLASQPLHWSWDVIVDGKVHPTFGEFTQVQKMLIQSFLIDNNVTLPLPTTVAYGMGLPDTALPQHTPTGTMLFIASSGGASISDSSQYLCDIAAYFREHPVPKGWLSFLLRKHETKKETELIGVQSVVCWDGGRVQGRDVVRERI